MISIDRLVLVTALRFLAGATAGAGVALAATEALGLQGAVPFGLTGALTVLLGAASAHRPLHRLRSEYRLAFDPHDFSTH